MNTFQYHCSGSVTVAPSTKCQDQLTCLLIFMSPPLVSYPRFSSMHRRWFLRLWRRTRDLEVVGSTSDCSTVV